MIEREQTADGVTVTETVKVTRKTYTQDWKQTRCRILAAAKSELWTRMFHFYMLHRDEFLEHYHKRSNVETTFHMIKAKFGQRLRSKSLTAQINESLCKVLCHNLCVVIQSVHELGVEAAFSSN